jgi:hypothetical protein
MKRVLQPQSQNSREPVGGKPIHVDVLAEADGKTVRFSHSWRFDDGQPQPGSTIEVPRRKKEDLATPIRFHLIDRTQRKLRFDDADPIWIARNCCPDQQSGDPEIPTDCIKPSSTTLAITDLNREQCTLHYTLRFRDRDDASECYDPEIKNGGIGL